MKFKVIFEDEHKIVVQGILRRQEMIAKGPMTMEGTVMGELRRIDIVLLKWEYSIRQDTGDYEIWATGHRRPKAAGGGDRPRTEVTTNTPAAKPLHQFGGRRKAK